MTPARHLVRQHYYLEVPCEIPRKWIPLSHRTKPDEFFAASARNDRQAASSCRLQPRPTDAVPLNSVKRVCDSRTSGLGATLPADLETMRRGADATSGHVLLRESDPGYMIFNHFAKRTAKRLESSGETRIPVHSERRPHVLARSGPRAELIDNP
jgi:hypothetical protein